MDQEVGSPPAVGAAAGSVAESRTGLGVAPATGPVVAAPDLILRIDALPGGSFAASVTDGAGTELLAPEKAATFSLGGGAQPILQQFRTVTLRPNRDWEGAINDLGEQLWDMVPEGVRAFYWREMHGQDLSVLVASDEPSMAWELVKPRPGPAGETAPMLGRAFAMTRWKQERPLLGSVAVSGFAAIAPAYNGRRLPGAAGEIGTLANRYGAREVPGTFATVGTELRSPTIDAIHFSGHGAFDPATPEEGQLVLSDRPLRLADVSDVDFRRAQRPPLVFLNACQVGRQGWTSTGVGGWAAAFRDAGCAAFVGPYWSVNSQIASLAALQFYQELETETLGRAMRAVRNRFATDARAAFHPTWLAYTVHGHPNATVRFAPGA